MITFEKVFFGYVEEGSTLQNLSFTIEKGSVTALVGANGAGKTTLAKLIRGLIRPTSGRILFEGEDIAKCKASTLASRMGYLFQNPDRQICKNTVGEEMDFTLERTVKDEAERERLKAEVLEALQLDPSDEPFLLSRGERQKVALASALVHRPELLILDEPTTGLDYKECTQIMEYVKTLNQQGVTVIMVCHDMEIVLDYADHVIVMRDGKITADGETRKIFQDPSALTSSALLPPQIIGLSALLQADGYDGFEGICTVDEMTAQVEARRKAVTA